MIYLDKVACALSIPLLAEFNIFFWSFVNQIWS